MGIGLVMEGGAMPFTYKIWMPFLYILTASSTIKCALDIITKVGSSVDYKIAGYYIFW